MIGQVWFFLHQKKGKTERENTLKHDVYYEYRASTYQTNSTKDITMLMLPSIMFKAAMASAALDLPGITKSQVKRLVWVVGDQVFLYGVPQIFMNIMRMADMNRTPDVRTRAIIPEWCCKFSIQYNAAILNEQSIMNLLANAGMYSGVSDSRQEKGHGRYGQFILVGKTDKRFKAIIAKGKRAAQEKALSKPKPYDAQTKELLSWFDKEAKRRGFDTQKELS